MSPRVSGSPRTRLATPRSVLTDWTQGMHAANTPEDSESVRHTPPCPTAVRPNSAHGDASVLHWRDIATTQLCPSTPHFPGSALRLDLHAAHVKGKHALPEDTGAKRTPRPASRFDEVVRIAVSPGTNSATLHTKLHLPTPLFPLPPPVSRTGTFAHLT